MTAVSARKSQGAARQSDSYGIYENRVCRRSCAVGAIFTDLARNFAMLVLLLKNKRKKQDRSNTADDSGDFKGRKFFFKKDDAECECADETHLCNG